MLTVHRSEDSGTLLDQLASALASAGGDPLAPEIVAVPTRGVERFIAQRLAGRLGASPDRDDGVCANVLFPAVSTLLVQTAGRGSGIAPEEDPWPPERAVWPLIEVAGSCAEQPWLAPLAPSLTPASGRRFGQLQAIARLYHRYGLQRPALIQRWAADELTPAERAGWQAPLWQALRERLALPSPAERLPGACAQLRAHPQLADLPPRLAVFGVSRLAAAEAQVLAALAANREIQVLIPHPSDALWQALARDPGSQPQNRLLASWGRELRDLEHVVGPLADHDHHLEPRRRQASTPPALLATLQAQIVADRPFVGAPLSADQPDRRLVLAPEDDSISVHSCHGAARQVEVLRDAILHRLARDPTLECRDIVVMCPDVERFAPLVAASFAATPELSAGPGTATLAVSAPPSLPVRIADRAAAQTNPLLAACEQLIELADGRLTATDVLDFADREPVRARFHFDDEELTQLREWTQLTAIHWGLDDDQRARAGLAKVELGTWQFGLRRLLLSVALGEQDAPPLAGIAPLPVLGSGQIDLAGRFAELLDRLAWALAGLREPQSPSAFGATLLAACTALTDTPGAQAWQLVALQRIVRAITRESAGTAELELSLAEARELFSARLARRPTRANFGSGAITLCAMSPMRAVPYRLICLLGLDDGAFPRRALHDGDDLLAADPQPGDRDPRREDRQLLLDALMAARDGLIVTYSGNDERSGARRPPAVVLGELLDAVDATARLPDPESGAGAVDADRDRDGRRRARDQVRIVHPLAAADPVNFTAGALASGITWSYDSSALAGARAGRRPPRQRPPLLARPLPAPAGMRLIELDALVRFVSHPVREFFHQRFGLNFAQTPDGPEVRLPIELDGWATHAIGQRLLAARLRGVPGQQALIVEQARGALPPGALGERALNTVGPLVNALTHAAVAELHSGPEHACPIELTLPDRTEIRGVVGGVRGSQLAGAQFARLAPGHRLAAWVKLLALTAADPQQPFTAVIVARQPSEQRQRLATTGGSAEVAIWRLASLGASATERREAARQQLAELLSLWRAGICEPLPLPPRSAAAYAAEALVAQHSAVLANDPLQAAREQWQSSFNHVGEDRDPEHQLAFGDHSPLDALGDYAMTLWQGLLEHERRRPR